MGEIKSREQLLAEFATFLRAYNRQLDTGDNSLAKDLLLTPYSIGAKGIMDQVAVARDLAILSRLKGTDLDNEGTNYGLERLLGRYAVVTLTFYATVTPTSNILIPADFGVQTASTSFVTPVSFSTVNQSTFTVADMNSYFSYDRNRYEFNVTALCNQIGVGGNVGSGMIGSLVGSIAGINGVTNLTAATGGEDQELDDDFRERIRTKKTGRDLNIVNGIRNFFMTYGFLDCFPVRIEDPDAEKASGIDVFAIDSSSSAVEETFTYDPAQPIYYFSNRPVLEVTAVNAAHAGALANTKYDAHLDNTSPLRRSVYSQDYMEVKLSASLLPGELFTVRYNYAGAIKNAQDTVNLVTNKVLTADVLLKKAYPLYLYLNGTLSLTSNADGPATRTQCKNALAQYMTRYRLGTDVQKSDLVIIIQQGFGDYPVTTVDYVTINSFYLMDEYGVTYLPSNEVISLNNKQYTLYGNAVLV